MMPRDTAEVTEELKKLGWEIPEPVLNDLTLNLMPNEAGLGILLGKGQIRRGNDYENYDLIMLAATHWRFLLRGIGGRNDWGKTEIFWQYMGFSRFTMDDDRYYIMFGLPDEANNPVVGVRYRLGDVKQERYIEFVTVVQRQLQAAKSAF